MTIESYLKNAIGPSKDYIFKEIKIAKEKVLLVFNETLIDTGRTNDFVLRSLIYLTKKQLKIWLDFCRTDFEYLILFYSSVFR